MGACGSREECGRKYKRIKPFLYSGYMKTWNAEGAFWEFTFSYLKNLLSCLMALSNCLAGRR